MGVQGVPNVDVHFALTTHVPSQDVDAEDQATPAPQLTYVEEDLQQGEDAQQSSRSSSVR